MKEKLFPMYRRLSRASRTLGLPKLPGARAVHRKLVSALRPSKGEVTLPILGIQMTFDATDEGLAPYLIEDGIYEEFSTSVFTGLLHPGMTVLDVGSNFGYYTLIAAKKVGPSGVVHAFEPEPRNFSLLRRNISSNNFVNVTAHPLALSDRKGRLDLYAEPNNLGTPSLAEENLPGAGSATSVEATTLDAFLRESKYRSVDLIKMDVQGAEGLVIKGGRNVFEQLPVVVMEFWPKGLRNLGTDPEALVRELKELGFRTDYLDEESRRIKELDVGEVIEQCDSRLDGDAAVNLLLRPS